jgi:hypothetical protein
LDDLPITVCARAPHLSKIEQIAEFKRAIDQHRPVLVILDPLYLTTMSWSQRAEVEAAHAAIRRAAKAHQAASSDDGPSEPNASDLAEGLGREDHIGTAQAAEMLSVGQRQVCKLAEVWECQRLARRVGRTWLIDRDVVVAYQDQQGRRSA